MVEYDPYMPEIKQDPYPVYRRLRAEQPVYYMERWDAWALALFEDIWQASQDPVRYSARNSIAERPLLERVPAQGASLASADPPLHTKLRSHVFPHFGPKAARALEPRIRAWALEAIERHRDTGRIDAVGDLAQQIAIRVACAVSGFRPGDADYLVDLVHRTFAREPGTDGRSQVALDAQQEAGGYLLDLVLERQKGPRQSDAIDALLHYGSGDEALTAELVAQHLSLLLVGATETFPKVFASALLRLWQHPDQRAELREDPGLIPTALLEMLRYDMPTQWLGRTVVQDHEIRGHKLRAGQPVIFLYPSGNRDEREFVEPDVFDIHRNPPRYLTFGHGIHRCLGSFMARMEGKVLLEETLRHFPEYEVLEDELVRPATEFVQGYSHFPIAF